MERLKDFYILQEATSTEGAQWCRNPISLEELTDAENFLYATTVEELREALERLAPHPVPGFTHVAVEKESLRGGGLRGRIVKDKSFWKGEEGEPLRRSRFHSAQELSEVFSAAAKQFPSNYSTVFSDCQYGYFCQNSSDLASTMLDHGMLQSPHSSLEYYLATEKELAAYRQREERRLCSRERARLYHRGNSSLLMKDLKPVACTYFRELRIPIYVLARCSFSELASALLLGCVLVDRVHGRATHRRCEAFQTLLTTWREKTPKAKAALLEKSPDLYHFLEKESAYGKPRKLWAPVLNAFNFRGLDPAGKIVPLPE
ncbi:MAG: hypothetical protein LHW56_01855 [Candidatus Cloacimonetes bacterium]|nr:hypothetical protein [Candidatus Cloacimonadota bacterium]MDY0171632.1 hypothetical protein [Candidatus Cloacimonadaceae bacterium]